jgi:DNA repair exonuclease SbcCD ATPase subunit
LSKIIFLKQLSLKNFKGIKDLTIDFSKITNIYGENATGKTTIFDAFTWLLFDKDSQDRSKFDVQPLDGNNNVIHMLETEVSAVVEIDNIKTVLKKVLSEKWVKKRGEVEAELKGTESSYYVDEVPFKQVEYKSKIREITGDEEVFKLLTNPLYFSIGLKWQDRRKIIFELNGDVSIEDVINYNDKLGELSNLLKPNEDMDNLSKRVKSQKAKLKKDKESIPARVDELNRTMRNDIDFNIQESNKRAILLNINALDEKILDSSKVNEEVLNKKNQVYDLKAKLNDMEYDFKSKAQEPLNNLNQQLRDIERNIYDAQSKVDRAMDKIKAKDKNIPVIENSIATLKKQWYEVNDEILEFDENEFICPTCKRPFEADDIEAKKQEMTDNFNQSKAERKKQINEKGKAKSNELEELKTEIAQLKHKFETYDKELTDLVSHKAEVNKQILEFKPSVDFNNNKEYQELRHQISKLEAELNTPSTVDNQVQELRHQKANLEIELGGINNLIAYKEQNIKLKERIDELQAEEKRLAQLIADLEKQEYLTEEFIKTKVELLESSINNKFKYVKFKLFDIQKNGGLNESCEALIDGVPFSNANKASRYNAGIDIINILSEHFKVTAPIFIDNRESVNRIIPSNSQIINLRVSQDKKLRLESEEI